MRWSLKLLAVAVLSVALTETTAAFAADAGGKTPAAPAVEVVSPSGNQKISCEEMLGIGQFQFSKGGVEGVFFAGNGEFGDIFERLMPKVRAVSSSGPSHPFLDSPGEEWVAISGIFKKVDNGGVYAGRIRLVILYLDQGDALVRRRIVFREVLPAPETNARP